MIKIRKIKSRKMWDKQKYWYMTQIESCPVCGEENIFKYRVYGEKPENRADRIKYTYIHHWCDV